MDITVKYMLRPVAHCKEGCGRVSWRHDVKLP